MEEGLVFTNTEVDRLLLSAEWREAMWRQLEKDMLLSGNSGFPNTVPTNMADMLKVLESFIESAKSSNIRWFNIKYQVDLPNAVDWNQISESEVARIILYRALQKVWLRRQLGASSSE